MKFLFGIFLPVFSLNGVFALIFNCNFANKNFTHVTTTLFGCTVNLLSPGTTTNIEDITGNLAAGKSFEDVEFISVTRKTMPLIPQNLNEFLPNLKAIQIYSSKLETVFAEDFKPFSKLEHLNLAGNLLTTLPVDLFKNNRDLKLLYIYNNELETVAQGILDGLNSLKDVQLVGNACISLDAQTVEEIEMLKEELLLKCLAEGETIAPKTTTLIITSTLSTTLPTTTLPKTTTESCQHRCSLNDEVDELKLSLDDIITLTEKLESDLEKLKANFTMLEDETEMNGDKITELEKRECNNAYNGFTTVQLDIYHLSFIVILRQVLSIYSDKSFLQVAM